MYQLWGHTHIQTAAYQTNKNYKQNAWNKFQLRNSYAPICNKCMSQIIHDYCYIACWLSFDRESVKVWEVDVNFKRRRNQKESKD